MAARAVGELALSFNSMTASIEDLLRQAAEKAEREDPVTPVHDHEAMAARVVADVPGSRGRLRFAHVLIRDTLYIEAPCALSSFMANSGEPCFIAR